MRRNHHKHNARMYSYSYSIPVVGLIVVVVTILLGYWGLDSKCSALGEDIKQREKELRSLDDEYLREEARWNANKTPEKLEAALIAHGLNMVYPKADQLVRMDQRGKPVEGQLSIAKFNRNPSPVGNVAKNKE